MRTHVAASRHLALMAVLLLASPAAPARAQGGAAAAAEAEVRTVIADYNAAYGRNDLDTYFKAFAPDLTQWFPSGRVDLESYARRGPSQWPPVTGTRRWRCATCGCRSAREPTPRWPPTSCA
ncbi:MAG: hypothetical protein R2708_17115 [Vicinamibacterales bacterium]